MKPKYSHILSPIKVGNIVLKDRLISGNALPHFLQGPETFPNEQVIDHVIACAKNGAAVVTFADWTNKKQRESFNEDGKRFPMYALDDDVAVENYISQMADQVHYYNSKISLAIMPFFAPDLNYDINEMPEVDLSKKDPKNFRLVEEDEEGDIMPEIDMATLMRRGRPAKQMPPEMIAQLINDLAERAHKYQKLGFDMCTLHFAYRATLLGRFLSPITNHRTDEYGGSVENRARILVELARKIKEVCGKDFIVEVQITPEEEEADGNKIEDVIQIGKLCEQYVDIFQLRACNGNMNHPTGYNSHQHKYAELDHASALKAAGVNILMAPIGGFQDPDDMEEALASGKCDMIAAARAFFVDYDFFEKIIEDRAEDITPCIRCNKCHVPYLDGKWVSFCSVNPRVGINHKVDFMTVPVTKKKTVAVIGGGPAGMRAAVFACDRGHEVTLYEKSDKLGGQIKLMDNMSFKWPLVQYRDWLIGQVNKRNITVRMNTEVTPESLGDHYNVVMIALGASPKRPPIKGVENSKTIFETLGKEKELGKRVVVVGGSESGTETGMYLAEHGHDVIVLTRGTVLAADATPIHYREMLDEYYIKMDNFKYHTEVTTIEIGADYVKYVDKDGREYTIECDDVVALGGMQGHSEEALGFYGLAKETFMVGDVNEAGNLHKCNRMAFSAAYQI